MKHKRDALMRIPFILACTLVFIVTAVGPLFAGEAMDQVRVSVDQVLNILRSKELGKKGKEAERRAALRKTISARFDFEEMAKRSLATHWRVRTPEEKKEFVALYTDLLERSYVNKIESYEDETIVYTDETLDGEYALVKTKIVTKRNTQIPIDYRLKKENGQWYAYDVIIEGVSLVNNYRTQFNNIIRQNSYEALIKRMKSKREEDAIPTKK
jgi:phospholipid transport system substrate-binding protein